MQDGALPHFAIPIWTWLHNRLPVLNDLCKVPVIVHVISISGNGPKMNSTNQNQEHLMNWNKFEILLALFFLVS
jgi:hypothetical protein